MRECIFLILLSFENENVKQKQSITINYLDLTTIISKFGNLKLKRRELTLKKIKGLLRNLLNILTKFRVINIRQK